VNQWERLVAEATIDGEVADVGSDDASFRVEFGKRHEGGVARVHLRVFIE
jgi:hypothetical protein